MSPTLPPLLLLLPLLVVESSSNSDFRGNPSFAHTWKNFPKIKRVIVLLDADQKRLENEVIFMAMLKDTRSSGTHFIRYI